MAADCDPKAWAGALVAVAQAGASLTEVDGPLELASAGSAAVWLSPADAGYLAVRVAGGGRRARLGCADVAGALGASPGRADVLDAGALPPEGADPDALRELWPSLVITGDTGDDQWAEEAFGMARCSARRKGWRRSGCAPRSACAAHWSERRVVHLLFREPLPASRALETSFCTNRAK